jgi:hypothetical protein
MTPQQEAEYKKVLTAHRKSMPDYCNWTFLEGEAYRAGYESCLAQQQERKEYAPVVSAPNVVAKCRSCLAEHDGVTGHFNPVENCWCPACSVLGLHDIKSKQQERPKSEPNPNAMNQPDKLNVILKALRTPIGPELPIETRFYLVADAIEELRRRG